MKPAYLLLLFICYALSVPAQKVGVVLSGGGAAGSAHVGVLKALEENEIPIDFITGTSIGALVGGFYAAGYSPEQIEQIIETPEFKDAANGYIEERYKFYLYQSEDDASVLSLSFNLDSVLYTNLPTNFISSTPIDFGLMGYFASANAAASENFDSLMIPFRCLASNISERKQSILKGGDLASAIRASMTYPFYLAPITINGDLMFDGGLYNNFPVDVLCMEFDPDIIIASNVASIIETPTEDNLLSQIKNILIKEPKYDIDCGKGVVINSDVADIPTFDFYSIEDAIQRGYNSTIKLIDSIKVLVDTKRSKEITEKRREAFNSKKPSLLYSNIRFEDLHPNQAKYFRQSLMLDSNIFTQQELSPQFYKLASNEKIKNIYPSTTFNKENKTFDLFLKVKKEKSFKASFGGVIGSKPFSTGFFELDYQFLRGTGLLASGNIYFGSFYSSAQGRLKWDIPFDIPFYLESKFTINRYDYFNSRATFIEEEDPPYIITSERYWENQIALPVLTRGKILFGASYLWQELEYYQDDNFQRGDTADLSNFEGLTTFAAYQQNSLNRKMYASKGSFFNLRFRFIDGQEKTQPGSQSSDKTTFIEDKNWLIISGKYEKYFFSRANYHLGLYLEGTYSDQPFFQNYTATLLNAPAFTPLPESWTIFQEEYRAKSFAAGGIKAIYSIRETVDFRLEAYLFQPYEEFLRLPDGKTALGEEGSTRNIIGTFTTVYHTRIGPLAASLNYYNDAANELSFLVHFGYIIHNKNGLSR
jgi:NTE family protein